MAPENKVASRIDIFIAVQQEQIRRLNGVGERLDALRSRIGLANLPPSACSALTPIAPGEDKLTVWGRANDELLRITVGLEGLAEAFNDLA